MQDENKTEKFVRFAMLQTLMHNIAAVASEDICRILFVCLVGVLRFKFEV